MAPRVGLEPPSERVRIAASVVGALGGAALSEREQTSIRRLPANTEAYEYYLRGRQTLFRQTRGDLSHSVRMFERAIDLDPAYAPAHAGLADCYRLLGAPGWEAGPPIELLAKARAAADRALALDPASAEFIAHH